MTRIYIATPSPQQLEDNTNLFLAAMKSGSRAPQNQLFTTITFDFLDLMLQALFFGPTAQITLNSFRQRLTDALGSVIKSTAHGLIRSIIAKLSNEELRPLVAYVEDRRIYLDGISHTTFPLPTHFATRFQVLHEAIMSGNRDNIDEQIDVMNEFIDIALQYLLRIPIDLLKLGFIARKGAELGHATVRALAHSTVRKLATDISLEENQKLSLYFYQLMKEGPEYRGHDLTRSQK